MVTASLRNGIYTYKIREHDGTVLLRFPKHALNIVAPYLNERIKKPPLRAVTKKNINLIIT